MAQVVEHILGKDEVGSSSLPSSSKKAKSFDLAFLFCTDNRKLISSLKDGAEAQIELYIQWCRAVACSRRGN